MSYLLWAAAFALLIAGFRTQLQGAAAARTMGTIEGLQHISATETLAKILIAAALFLGIWGCTALPDDPSPDTAVEATTSLPGDLPVDSAPPVTLSEEEVTTMALESTWSDMTYEQRLDVCTVVHELGPTVATDAMFRVSDGYVEATLDPGAVERFLSLSC